MEKNWKIAVAAFFVVSAAAIYGIFLCTKTRFNDGVYIGAADGRNGPVEIEVTIENGKAVAAKILKEEESDFAKSAITYVLDEFLKSGSVNGIDAISGSTITTNAAIAAVQAALFSAQGKTAKAEKMANAECDIAIIGAGGAGLCAAIEASDAGAKTIVLEKMGILGGNTNSATGGLNASQTRYQSERGINDSNEQYFEDTMKGGYQKNDAELVHNMVEKSAETVDWLVSKGADLTDVGKMAGSTNSRTHRPTGGAAVGAHLVPVLEKAARESGAEIRLNSKVTDIEKIEGGFSVKVESKNGNYAVNAKTVIVATGGFGANPEMIIQYRPDLKGFGTTNHKGATGDAFAWFEKFGAQFVQLDEIQTHPTVVPGNGTMITEAVRGNGAIIVNREGKRFCSEMATRDVMSEAILAQTGQTAFLVFDEDVRKSLKAIEGYVTAGLLTEDSTIEGLAKKLQIPSDALKTTMENFALIVASASDDAEFGRKASEMPRPLTQSPFYAVEIGPAIHHTMGGVKIDVKARVIDKNENPIEGLFACGEVTGGVHGGNRLGGNAIADICVYGKIAADSAIEFIGK